MFKHHSALGLATALRPVQPVTLLRPHAAARAARFFTEKFPGTSLYAVKANPSPDLLEAAARTQPELAAAMATFGTKG